MSDSSMDVRNKQIGDNIRKYRLLKGLTNDELCKDICSPAQLSKIENGKTYAQRDILKHFADRLDTTVLRLESKDAMEEELRERLHYAVNTSTIGEYKRSIELTNDIISRCVEFGYTIILFDCYLHKSITLIKAKDYKTAITFLESILDQVPQESQYYPSLLYHLGFSHQYDGNVFLAHDCFTRAYESFESIEEQPDDTLELKLLFATAQSYGILKYNRLAFRYAEKAENLAEKLSKHLYRLRSKYMKATILKRLGDIDKAQIELEQSLKEAETNDYVLDLAIICLNLGEMHRDKQEYGLAYSYFERAKNLLQLLNNEQMVVATILQFAELDILTGNYQKSNQHIDKAFSMMDNLNSDIYLERARAYKLLAKIQLSNGDFDTYKSFMLMALEIYSEKSYYIDAYEVSAQLAKDLDQRQDTLAIEMYRKSLEYNELILENGMRR